MGGLLRRLLISSVLVAILAPGLSARFPFRRGSVRQRATNSTQRRRLHADNLITDIGTVEIEWGNSFAQGIYAMPTALKFTPSTGNLFWRDTEFSLHSDGITSTGSEGGQVTQWSDRVTLAASRVVYDNEALSVAVAPQATFFFRNEQGARIGVGAFGRYDLGPHTIGANFTWTGATVSSPTNPAGSFELGGGYAHRLGYRWTLFGNTLYERPTTGERFVSFFEGANLDLRATVTLEVAGQHFNVVGGGLENRMFVGLIVNLGPPRRWFYRKR